ncbi:Polyadenylate-binding protein 5 [Acorus calamus]|uniref:Polyadenylate-binding protein 5 n=1 Tax=Acorus calamus TaxID=4465 RepID=A0AAV9FGB5_ACOCL|nr:Polyadenylate-binding protein 5 [Acorus calamus]
MEALGKVGEVLEVRLVRERSGRSRGFAFVRFATVEQARRAIKELRTVKVNGKLCGVMKSNDNVTLHLGNICKSWTKEMLEEKLKSLRLEKIEEVHLMNDPHMKGMNRGYAFLDFRTHMDAVAGCIKLQRQDAFFGTDARAVVSFSMSACEPDEEVMAQVKSVFLDRLPGTWDEDKVHEECKKFGEIRSIQLACNMPTAKRNDFCFVCFETREAALECIEKVNKDGLGNGSQKILVKASLKKPLPKWSSQMMNSRRGYTGDHSGGRQLREYETESYPVRSHRNHESYVEGRGSRYIGGRQYSVRGDNFRPSVDFPRDRFTDRSRRESVREVSGELIYLMEQMPGDRIPASTIARSRSKDVYLERSPSSRRTLGGYYYQSQGIYPEDMYYPLSDHYETSRPDLHEYSVSSRSKRPYSSVDYPFVTSSSLPRRVRSSRSMLEVENDYPLDSMSRYDEYSRVPPDDHYDYEIVEYPTSKVAPIVS